MNTAIQDFPKARQQRAEAAQAEAIRRHAEKPQERIKVRVPGKSGDILSSDGSRYYQWWFDNDSVLHDNCPAGQCGRDCKHKREIRAMAMTEDGYSVETRPLAPDPDDPFFPHPAEVLIPVPPLAVLVTSQAVPSTEFHSSEERIRSLAGYLS